MTKRSTFSKRKYLRFVAAGVNQGRRVELQGGGLIRSARGWQAAQALRRGREGDAGEERLLGSRKFVEQVRQEMRGRQAQGKGTQRVLPVEKVIERVCQAVGVRAEEIRGSGRRAAVSRAQTGVAYLTRISLHRSLRTRRGRIYNHQEGSYDGKMIMNNICQ